MQRILAYRQLGFDLEAIGAMLDDPELDELAHLRRQKTLLQARRDRIDAMLGALDKTMAARKTRIDLDPSDSLEEFGEFETEVEKGGEVGAHILSGCVLEPRAFRELLPDNDPAAIEFSAPATDDRFLFLTATGGYAMPTPPQPITATLSPSTGVQTAASSSLFTFRICLPLRVMAMTSSSATMKPWPLSDATRSLRPGS